MHTFTKTIVAAMVMAIGATALPTTAQADDHDDYRKHIKKAIKHRRKAIKQYYKHNDHYRYRSYYPGPSYYSPYNRYRHWDHDDDDYDHESFRIYTTPYGGLGFSYSESEGSYW